MHHLSSRTAKRARTLAVTDRRGGPETEDDDAELRWRVRAKKTTGQIARELGARYSRASGCRAEHVSIFATVLVEGRCSSF